jgi:hypothetical protein
MVETVCIDGGCKQIQLWLCRSPTESTTDDISVRVSGAKTAWSGRRSFHATRNGTGAVNSLFALLHVVLQKKAAFT